MKAISLKIQALGLTLLQRVCLSLFVATAKKMHRGASQGAAVAGVSIRQMPLHLRLEEGAGQ
jgi:hypothetical protein